MRSSADWLQRPDGEWAKAESIQTRGLNRKQQSGRQGDLQGCSDHGHHEAAKGPTERGLPHLAKLTIAPEIAAITLAMWKNKEAYNPAKYRKQIT
jgi:hypothetical protein